jgi:hypothetical protein
MNYLRCEKCGCKLSKEDPKYLITIDIVADCADLLPNKNEIAEHTDKLIYQLEESEGLEGEAYEEISFVLCKECTDYFSKYPLGGKNRFVSLKMGLSQLLH